MRDRWDSVNWKSEWTEQSYRADGAHLEARVDSIKDLAKALLSVQCQKSVKPVKLPDGRIHCNLTYGEKLAWREALKEVGLEDFRDHLD